MAYSLIPERLDLGASGASAAQNKNNANNNAPRLGARRGRIIRTSSSSSRGRAASGVIMGGNRAIVPAQFVPEDLISQAQVVLQGKSRNLIVKELQRTNLDVNLAVNNLLSRDDEDAEDMDDSQESYLQSEDLMSLLDAGISNDHGSVLIDADFPEDVFNNYSSSVRMRSTNSLNRLSRATSIDRESLERDHMLRFASDRASGLGASGSSNAGANAAGSSNTGPSSRRWLEYALRDSGSASESSKLAGLDSQGRKGQLQGGASSQQNAFYVSGQLEYWQVDGNKKFTQMIGLYSELVAISSNGQLFQWKWNDLEPYSCQISEGVTIYHPKVLSLCLMNEKITHLAGVCVRASVVTESNKVATWVDDAIQPVASKLEHPTQSFPEFSSRDKIASLYCCSLYTCVRLESGHIYWWGVPPYTHRKKMWEKLKIKSKKQKTLNNVSEIVQGSQVCMRNSPSYNSGSIAFNISSGVPKVGQLISAAWSVTDSYLFKILTAHELRKLLPSLPSITPMPSMNKFDLSSKDKDQPASPSFPKCASSSSQRLEMPPPPSPASSTCSEPGASPLPKRTKRISNSNMMRDEERVNEETWNLADVVFLEDSKNISIGKVVKIDGQFAAVKFTTVSACGSGGSSANKEQPPQSSSSACGNGSSEQPASDLTSIFQDCRLMKKDDLVLIKNGAQSTKTPDCLQKTPKRVCIPDSTNIIQMNVSNKGLHAIVKNSLTNKLSYVVYNLVSCKIEQDFQFPTDSSSFFGQDQNLISLNCYGEGNDSILILRDGNGTIYPLAKDCNNAIKEPINLDLPPVQAMSVCFAPLKDSSAAKSQLAINVLILENQLIIPSILQSDPDTLRQTLGSLEKNSAQIQSAVAEKIDGNRNILHAAVAMCFPTSNKYQTETNLSEDLNLDNIELMSSSRGHSDLMLSADIIRMPTVGLEQSSNSRSNEDDQLNNLAGSAGNSETPLSIYDPSEQKSLSVLWALTESPTIKPFLLKDLMSAKNSQGFTPFMLAVNGRAYAAAIHLFQVAQKITKQLHANDPEQQKKVFMSMIFPRGSNPGRLSSESDSTPTFHPVLKCKRIETLLISLPPCSLSSDDSPLYVVCCNDTCSFSWTGREVGTSTRTHSG